MANIFFNLKLTYPGITDDIRVSVYSTLDLSTPIASVQQNSPHLDQQYSFPGLPRQNFVYKVLQTEINGTTVIAQLGQASFVAANDELTQKAPVLIQVGVDNIPGTTTVFPSGVSTVTIPDFIGQAFATYGRPGQFPIKDDGIKHVDSQFDSATGKLDLLTLGDTFQDQEYWYFSFLPVISQSSGGEGGGTSSTTGFKDILLVTANTTLTSADIGKKILIAPSGNYLEITLPDYTSIPALQITYFEMVNSTSKCARIKATTGQTIEFPTDIYIKPNESFELYKRVVSTGVYEWRMQNQNGNFLSVGEFFFSDLSPDKIINAIELDGANTDYQKEARLYQTFVVRNGIAIAYSDWNSSNVFTYMKFSLKDTASNNFRVPDMNTTPSYLRPRGASSVMDFIAQQLLSHQHITNTGALPTPPFGQTPATQKYNSGGYKDTFNQPVDLTSRSVTFNTATGLYEIIDGGENRPNSRASRLYIKT